MGRYTAYTCGIADGSIGTAKEYLKKCIREFGICYEQHDEGLDTELKTHFTADTGYFEKMIQMAEDGIRRLEGHDPDDIYRAYVEQIRARNDMNQSAWERAKAENERYEKIRGAVETWRPPTKGHEPIKIFALEQIDKCMETPERMEELRYKAEHPDEPTMEDFEAWKASYIQMQREEIEYARRKIAERRADAEKRNEYMRLFLESLETIEE